MGGAASTLTPECRAGNRLRITSGSTSNPVVQDTTGSDQVILTGGLHVRGSCCLLRTAAPSLREINRGKYQKHNCAYPQEHRGPPLHQEAGACEQQGERSESKRGGKPPLRGSWCGHRNPLNPKVSRPGAGGDGADENAEHDGCQDKPTVYLGALSFADLP
jgi:hypothetical protein